MRPHRHALPWLVGATLALGMLAVPATAQTQPAPMSPDAFSKDPPEVRQLLTRAAEEIKGANVHQCIADITTNPEDLYRVMGSPTHGRFVQKYAKVFSSISPKIKDQVVNIGRSSPAFNNVNPNGYNIIGVLPGERLDEWVVLGGHHDTREATFGGAAIDNTSGICVVKELARAIVSLDVPLKATIVFAWWDGEEWGLYGSTSFANDHSATKQLLGLDKDHRVTILSAHSYDIVGINYPAYNTWALWGSPTDMNEYANLNLRTAPTTEAHFSPLYTGLPQREDIDWLLANYSAYQGLVQEIGWNLFQLPTKHINIHNDRYGRSDHVPFIRAGWPGMRIQGSHDCGTGSNGCQWPHYHMPSDTLASAELMAGGRDRLIAGLNTAADIGGLTALYIASQGWYGPYSNQTGGKHIVLVERARATVRTAPAGTDANTQETPGPPAALVGLIVLLGAALWARRRP